MIAYCGWHSEFWSPEGQIRQHFTNQIDGRIPFGPRFADSHKNVTRGLFIILICLK